MYRIFFGMFTSKYINISVFALSFLLGLIAVYMMNEGETRKVFVFPTPENVEMLQYKDSTDTCFEFRQMEVHCPTNMNNVSNIPVQP